MGWLLGRKKTAETPREHDSLTTLALFDLENRFSRLERVIEAQTQMLDERTRLMAESMSAELRAVGRIMADLATNMAALNAKLDAQGEALAQLPALLAPPTPAMPPPMSSAVPSPLPERVREKSSIDELAILTPPSPANDPPAEIRREIDPMVLDALAKGRVAFDLTLIANIPPRAPLLAMMRLAPPFPAIDSETVDRLADVFPDAALLIDRLMIDAAGSMVKSGQIPADLPLLVPVSPVTARHPAHAADFRRRFERATHRGGIFPLLSEQGWIALVEGTETGMDDLAASGFAIRASGTRRIDHAAIGMLGVRYVLAQAAILSASGQHPLAPDIHGADVARLFARNGIGLIAENVPDQVSVLGLLRNGISMGWGPALQLEPIPAAPSAETPAPPAERDYRTYLRRAGS